MIDDVAKVTKNRRAVDNERKKIIKLSFLWTMELRKWHKLPWIQNQLHSLTGLSRITIITPNNF